MSNKRSNITMVYVFIIFAMVAFIAWDFTDVLYGMTQGTVGIDSPWEDFLVEPLANAMYGITDIMKDARDGFAIGGFRLFEDGSYWLDIGGTRVAEECLVWSWGCK